MDVEMVVQEVSPYRQQAETKEKFHPSDLRKGESKATRQRMWLTCWGRRTKRDRAAPVDDMSRPQVEVMLPVKEGVSPSSQLPDQMKGFLKTDSKGRHENYDAALTDQTFWREKIKLKNTQLWHTFRTGSFKDTSYKDTPDLLEEWEQFYLDECMKMKVIGTLEKFPCNGAELVLMECEDGKVFGYEEERLHLVADNLRELFESGVQFPGIKYYYRGQRFEDMTEDDWDEVKKSISVVEKARKHQAMVEGMKSSYLKNRTIIKQQTA